MGTLSRLVQEFSFRCLGKLVSILQGRDLTIVQAYSYIRATRIELQSLKLGSLVSDLRTSIYNALLERFPVEESKAMSIWGLEHNYPDCVVKLKFLAMRNEIHHVLLDSDGEDAAEKFLVDYKIFREDFRLLEECGVSNISLQEIFKSRSFGPEIQFFFCLMQSVTPSSAEAERIISCISRLRSKFRQSLSLHLPGLCRIAQSKTLGGGSDYSDEFVSKCLKIWASMKSRRFKQSGKVAKRDDNKRFRIGTVDNDDSTSEVESESNIQRMQEGAKLTRA